VISPLNFDLRFLGVVRNNGLDNFFDHCGEGRTGFIAHRTSRGASGHGSWSPLGRSPELYRSFYHSATPRPLLVRRRDWPDSCGPDEIDSPFMGHEAHRRFHDGAPQIALHIQTTSKEQS
jgi:hypothetical protein